MQWNEQSAIPVLHPYRTRIDSWTRRPFLNLNSMLHCSKRSQMIMESKTAGSKAFIPMRDNCTCSWDTAPAGYDTHTTGPQTQGNHPDDSFAEDKATCNDDETNITRISQVLPFCLRTRNEATMIRQLKNPADESRDAECRCIQKAYCERNA